MEGFDFPSGILRPHVDLTSWVWFSGVMPIQVKVMERRPRTFWEQSYLPEIIRGLSTTISHLLKHLLRLEKMPTYEYPEQTKPIPEDYRGEHRLMLRPDDTIRCTACMLCATACPAECIEIIAAENPNPDVEKYPSVYTINLLRCVFCGLCVEACPCDAIRMDTQKRDMAGMSREEFILDINYLMKNHPEGKSPVSIAL